MDMSRQDSVSDFQDYLNSPAAGGSVFSTDSCPEASSFAPDPVLPAIEPTFDSFDEDFLPCKEPLLEDMPPGFPPFPTDITMVPSAEVSRLWVAIGRAKATLTANAFRIRELTYCLREARDARCAPIFQEPHIIRRPSTIPIPQPANQESPTRVRQTRGRKRRS